MIRMLFSLLLTAPMVGCAYVYTTPTAEDDRAESRDDEPDGEDGPADDDDEQSPPDGDEEQGDDDDEPPPVDDCTFDGFPAVMEQAVVDLRDPTHPLYVYQARDTPEAPFDELQMLSFQAAPYNGPSGPGNYSLQGSNYADCSLCLFVFAGCDEGYDCDEIYFADEGWLRIDAMAGPDEPFAASLSGVKFREVTIDEETWESTPVPGGATWCVDDYTTSTLAIGVY